MIFGTCYAYSEEYARAVLPVWLGCLAASEDLATTRIVLVDSGSDVDWARVFPCEIEYYRSESNRLFDYSDPGPGRLAVLSFRDNIGHSFHNPHVPSPAGIRSRDGAGRTLSQGIKLAHDWRMEHFAHVEGDAFLFGRRPVSRALAQLAADFAAPRWGRELETNLILGSVERTRDFVAVYDWESTPLNATLEMDLMDKFAGRYEWLEIEGGRGAAHRPSPERMVGDTPYFWTANREAVTAARYIARHWIG